MLETIKWGDSKRAQQEECKRKSLEGSQIATFINAEIDKRKSLIKSYIDDLIGEGIKTDKHRIMYIETNYIYMDLDLEDLTNYVMDYDDDDDTMTKDNLDDIIREYLYDDLGHYEVDYNNSDGEMMIDLNYNDTHYNDTLENYKTEYIKKQRLQKLNRVLSLEKIIKE